VPVTVSMIDLPRVNNTFPKNSTHDSPTGENPQSVNIQEGRSKEILGRLYVLTGILIVYDRQSRSSAIGMCMEVYGDIGEHGL